MMFLEWWYLSCSRATRCFKALAYTKPDLDENTATHLGRYA